MIIFPNPVQNGHCTVLTRNQWPKFKLSIYSTAGQLVSTLNDLSDRGNGIQLKLNLAAGIYLVRITHKDENEETRIAVLG